MSAAPDNNARPGAGATPGVREWSAADTARLVARPRPGDDKYSRGVLGVITGSAEFPGAAVLGVEAALRTGVGMVRYLGPGPARRLVLQRRPEVVAASLKAEPGRVQAWLLGSGMDAARRRPAATRSLVAALEQGVPTVLDAGALDLVSHANGSLVITPHARELSRLLDVDPGLISADPAAWAAAGAERLGVVVLLKGHRTHVAGPHGTRLVCPSATPWLATAGTGDALGGILGALLATHAAALPPADAAASAQQGELMLVQLAASASLLHARAALRASAGGPLTVLDLAAALPAVVAELLALPGGGGGGDGVDGGDGETSAAAGLAEPLA